MFGLQQAFMSLNKNSFIFFPSNFTKGNSGILINGLIQRGSISYIKNQFYKKINQGFNCIKIKIGQNNFNDEYELLKFFISKYPNIQIRLDANGTFLFKEAIEKLYKLYNIGIHSIEQPIINNKWNNISNICNISPLPIALDEELNGIYSLKKKKLLLDSINPKYLILKPSFCGGFQATMDWIIEAEKRNIKWWITSALETNIGLNAILQWTYCLKNPLPHGFDTINIYIKNNIYPFIHKKNIILYNPNIKFSYNLCG